MKGNDDMNDAIDPADSLMRHGHTDRQAMKDHYYEGQAVAQGMDPEEARRRMNTPAPDREVFGVIYGHEHETEEVVAVFGTKEDAVAFARDFQTPEDFREDDEVWTDTLLVGGSVVYEKRNQHSLHTGYVRVVLWPVR